MLIIKSSDIPPSEITPPEIYRQRRHFMQGVAALATGAFVGATPEAQAGVKLAGVKASGYTLADDKTAYKDVTLVVDNSQTLQRRESSIGRTSARISTPRSLIRAWITDEYDHSLTKPRQHY